MFKSFYSIFTILESFKVIHYNYRVTHYCINKWKVNPYKIEVEIVKLKRELKFLRTYCLGFYTCWIQAFLYQNFRFKVDLKQTYVLFHFHMWYILKCQVILRSYKHDLRLVNRDIINFKFNLSTTNLMGIFLWEILLLEVENGKGS
jgi:hypothetical protein